MINYTIEIKVERSLLNGKFQVLLCRDLDLPSGLSVPYESILSSLKFLFGHDCIVTFKMSSYETKH